MPSVTYDGQSFQINGQRQWLCGASIPYAFVPESDWPRAIRAVAEAGFNMVETAAPWSLHEPRPGRYTFDGQLDVARFVALCGEQGLRVMLRVGPYIGGSIDGGGLPPWLSEMPDVLPRQSGEGFQEFVGKYFRQLLGPLVEQQATQTSASAALGGRGGPLLLVQLEHEWHCANDEQGQKYLRELVRYIRECGITIPLLTANDLWQDVEGTIETWTGADDLLVNLRQLRDVQSHAPRIVTSFRPARTELWGEPATPPPSTAELMVRLGQVFAAGAQPVLSPYHPGTHFGFTSGRLPGDADRFVVTRGAVTGPLDEASRPTAAASSIRRLVNFATSFGHVFAELDPDYHPIAIDVEHQRAGGSPALSVVPLRGSQGHIVFVFAHEGGSSRNPRETVLLLENGIRLPVPLGDQPLGWFALDVDLRGDGHLDYANLCPFAIVGRTILVLQGPAGATGYISINGSPMEIEVPTRNDRAQVVEHSGITVVVCNQKQIDATVHDGEHVYVGTTGLEPDGTPLLAPGFRRVHRISAGANMAPIKSVSGSGGTIPAIESWTASPSDPVVEGRAARFATLDGPMSLAECGASTGYGWYRLELKGSPRKRLVHLPEGGDRFHLYVNGTFESVLGDGPGATPMPFSLRSGTGQRTLVFLADNLGRFAGGNDHGERKGFAGSLLEVQPLKGVRTARVEASPADPFELRGFISHRALGQMGDSRQVQWTFTHRRKSPVLLDLRNLRQPGTLVLNDQPIAYYAGETGGQRLLLLLDRETFPSMKSGQNRLRFSGDPLPDGAPTENVARALKLYDVVKDLSDGGRWAFARFEPPAATSFSDPSARRGGVAGLRGRPCWWRGRFSTPTPRPLWLDASALSKGQVYLNGRAVGRFFSAVATGARGAKTTAVGPQTSIFLPSSWMRRDEPNELLVFDEHGFSPIGAALRPGPEA